MSCNSEYYAFLRRLRNSGVTNMWGSPPFLVEEFGITLKEAGNVFISWINTPEEH